MTYFPGTPDTKPEEVILFGEAFYFPNFVGMYRVGKRRNLAARSSLLATTKVNLETR
jgi:hypothetical protein